MPCINRRCPFAYRVSQRGTEIMCFGTLSLTVSVAVAMSQCGGYMLRGFWDVYVVSTHCCFHKDSAHIPRDAVEHFINGRHGPVVQLAF